jgi:CRP-like cAMP-binding protein
VLSAHEVLTNAELVNLGIAECRDYSAGETIIVEGEQDRRVFLLEEGVARVTERVEIEGAKHIQPGLCDLAAGEIFGELGLFEPGPRSASVIAIEPCRVRVFDAERLSAHFETHPAQGYAVLKGLFSVLNQRLRKADKRLGALFAWGLKAHGIDQHL